MSGNLFAAIFIGFFVLVIIAVVYSALIGQPRMRRRLKELSEQRGWTYTAGKSLIVSKRSVNGYLLSPQETISNSIQGSDQGIHWRIDGVTVESKVARKVVTTSGQVEDSPSNSIYQIIWHSEDVRIEHGSVLLFLKPEGWTHDEGVGGMLKAGLQSMYREIIYDLMRRTYNIQNTPVKLGIPEFDAKYKVEVSDVGAVEVALTSEVRDFLIQQRPPATLIQLGDNALDIIAEDSTYFTKIEKFEKMAGLIHYGVQLAQVVAASQSAANPQSDATA
ncbi:MAG: hypothetical protein ABI700_10700 [Chloroflexota bacterium]